LLAQTTHVITTSGTSFSPKAITIREGDTVRWTNLQPNSHNVAQTDCPASPASVYNGGFFSGFGGDVDTFELTFDEAGEFCFICQPHVSLSMNGHITVEPVWSDLGGGTVGVGGVPVLAVDGPLTDGSALTVTLGGAAPDEVIVFWLATAPVPFGALGGTVWAFPYTLQVIRGTDAAGAFSQGVTWPAGIPVGTELTLQFLVQDLSVPQQIVLSNAVRATTP
jgi:plastocyanin